MSNKLPRDCTAVQLLDQIIEKAELDDEDFKKKSIEEHKALKSIGESWTCFHLKALRELILNGD